MMQPEFSFIIPVYKSVNSLAPLYDGIVLLMQELQYTFEVIFVDDNGSEESWKKLLELKKSFPDSIRLIKLTRNFGQNGATTCGIDEARGKFLVTLDDDLQVHPNEIKKLIACQKESNADVVYGVYKEKSVSFLRKSGSKLIKRIFVRAEGGSNVGSSIRLISGNIAAYLRHHSQDHLFLNQVISWYTFDAQFVEVERNQRFEGESGYSMYQLFKIALRLVFLYSSIPLKIMIVVCIVSAVFSLALAGYYIYKRFAFGEGLGFLSLMVLAISLVLASISVMGIYLNRIYSSRIKKPHYAVKLKL